MARSLTKDTLGIKGMSCSGCEMRIESVLAKLDGVEEVKALFPSSSVLVTYDSNVVGLDEIKGVLEQLGYGAGSMSETETPPNNQMTINHLLGIGIIVFALYFIINKTVGFNFIPQVTPNMGYGILFVTGMITSLHCIAMCGGINLSQCISGKSLNREQNRLEKIWPSLMYNVGRVVSYTIIGGAAGALGSVIGFSGGLKGAVIIISGVFMVIVGLNMLGLAPWTRRLNPRMPKIFRQKLYHSTGNRPFFIGLLNGLMPCGPLQAMQLYALGTGSFFAGALSMFLFNLGTVPLMFGLGALSTFLSSRFTHRMVKASAVLVMVLGMIMVSRGFNLVGFYSAFASPVFKSAGNVAQVKGNIQTVTTELEAGEYSLIVVQKGIPVQWTIRAEESDLNGCNNPVTIPKYGIEKTLRPGENVLEFAPTEEGNITYTCWMGMIRGNIKVVADVTTVNPEDLEDPAVGPLTGSPGGGCCAVNRLR